MILDGRIMKVSDQTDRVLCKVFDLAYSPIIDGIVAFPDTIHVPTGDDIEAARLGSFAGKPQVILNTKNPYFPTVQVDNITGVLASVAHLSSVHGFRKIAFLRGPEGNHDAEERFASYREGLARAGIEYDPSLAFPGDFRFYSGKVLAEALARSAIPPFDALIAANDQMAIGFQRTIERLGIKIPEDIALVGFDDDVDAVYMPCPLTTVRQPFVEICERGIDILIEMMDGHTPHDIIVPAEFVIRQSCGCLDTSGAGNSDLRYGKDALQEEILSLKDALAITNTFSCRAQGSHSPNNLINALDKSLGEIEMNYMAISLVKTEEVKEDERGGIPGLPTDATLRYLYRKGLNEEWDLKTHTYKLIDILPDETMPRGAPRSCLAMTLADAETLLGFLFFDLVQPNPVLCELFRSQISSIIGRTRLMESLIEKETRELVEIEKMNALGTLVAGVAHEINTPMGVSVTAASHLNRILGDLETTFLEGQITKTGLADFLADAHATGKLLEANLERSSSLVVSFKKVAVDSSSEERRVFRLKEYVSDILATLSPRLKHTNVTVTIKCLDDLVIDSYPGAFSQILTNLVVNSLDHAFEKGAACYITVSFLRKGNTLVWTYADDGKGIDPQVLPRVFEPFFTTKREAGGSGLGLHIVYNTVTRIFNGKIRLSSTPGKGVLFTITIPLRKEEMIHGNN